MTKETFMSKSFNNWLTAGLGLPTIATFVVALATGLMSEFASFIALATIGAVY